jgi:hypothetical protein
VYWTGIMSPMPRTDAVDGVMDIDTMVVGCPQLSKKTNIPSKHTNPTFFITRHTLLDPKWERQLRSFGTTTQ